MREKSPRSPQKKVRADIFPGSLAVFEKARPGGGCGGGGALAAARKNCSNLPIEAVPVSKRAKIGRRRPSDFRYTAEGFPFAPIGRGRTGAFLSLI